MVREWDRAPDFTAPMARPENASGRGDYGGDDIESFTLSDRLVYGPVVLAFFPGVYSGTCTDELCAMRDWYADLADLDAQVFGVSADTPWSQLAFIEEYDLTFPLLSGFNNDAIEEYGVRSEGGLLSGTADRSLFVVDEEQSVAYRWDAEPGELPDLGEVKSALEATR
ncbi:MAG: redoxin domain-containing protein [Halobacteriales archaeon]